MEHRDLGERWRFWLLALLWLPVGVAATAVFRLAPGVGGREPVMWLPMLLMSVPSLGVVAPCGLPLALGCRRLWRQGYRRAAWATGIGLGPIAILVYAAVLSLPVWTACWWLGRHNERTVGVREP